MAFTLRYRDAKEEIHVMLNAYWEPLMFELPGLGPHGRWHRPAFFANPTKPRSLSAIATRSGRDRP